MESMYLTTEYSICGKQRVQVWFWDRSTKIRPDSGKGKRREEAVMVWTGLYWVNADWVNMGGDKD